MALYLVQHGKSLPKDLDPEKGLSEEGKADVNRIAQVAKDYGVNVSGIRHSGKKRAEQTAEIFASSLNSAEGLQKWEGLKALDDVTKLKVDSGRNLMLVGHLPFMERLTSFLITGSADGPTVFKFQNGGIVCLDYDPETERWFIKWTLSPHIG